MELTATEKLVHQMYIAYYQRPADPEGLQYWVNQLEQNGNWSSVSAAFGAAEENDALYGGMSRADVIKAVYDSAFNRAAVDSEVSYWDDSGFSLTDLAFAIINGAQNDDLATVNAKVDFSAELGSQLGSNDAYLKLQNVNDLLDNVGADTNVTADSVSQAIASHTEGDTFTLTAGDDQFFGTEMNDTFTADAGTLGANDQLLDQSTTDNDTLNAVITNANKTAGAATLLNIENVNLDLDVFTGAAFDADSTTGATITGSSSKLGFNGEFEVKHAGDNNVVAGENVTDLTVGELEAGNVDAGAAETVDVTVSSGDTANVTANGDVALAVSGATDLNLTATADSEIDLTTSSGGSSTGSVDTIVGAGDGTITLDVEASGASADDISGVDTVSITAGSGGVDAGKWDVSTIDVAVDLGSASLTVADAANVELSKEQSGLTVSGSEATNTATVASALASVGTLTFSNLAAAELNLSATDAAVTSIDSASGSGAVALDINVTDGATIDTLSGSNLTLAGAGDVTVTNGDAASVLDASALDGALDLTSAASGGQEIAGGQGDNVIEFSAASGDKTYVGQSGNDEVTFSSGAADTVEVSFAGGDNTVDLGKVDTNGEVSVVGADGVDTLKLDGVTGTIAANLGAGDDVVEMTSGSNTSGDLTLAFGEGNDTLKMAAGADLSDASSVEITGLEAIEIGGSGNASFAADQLNGQELSVSSEDGGATLTVTGGSVDLSGVSLNNTVGSNATASITGSTNADTIVGTQGDDTITGSGGVDTLTGGDGADTFVLGAVSGSGIDVITDLNADEDKIQFASGAASGFTDIGELSTNDYATFSDALDSFASGNANATAAQAAYQFSYDGKDYLIVDGATAGYAATDDAVVEITGVTGTLDASDIIAV